MIDSTSLAPQLVAALVKGLEAETTRSVDRKTPNGDPSTDRVFERARLRGAVVGSFDPETIVPAGVPPEVRATVQRRLAAECDDLSDQRRRRWMLRAAPRRTALRSLQSGSGLVGLLGEVKLDPDDRFGSVLQQLLAGKPPDLAPLTTADLQLVHRAGEFAALARRDVGLDLEAVRTALGRRALDDTIASVMPNGLIGRQAEMATLLEFVNRPQKGSASDPLVVTGIGGCGKSTLIAALIRYLRSKDSPVPVILLDFDRPMVTAESVGELTMELSRQLGLQVPALSAPLARFRAEAAQRSALGSSENAPQSAVQSFQGSRLRGEHVTFSELGRIAKEGGILHRPIVVVLDTFEEVAVQGSAAVIAVRNWLASVAEFRALKTIVGGRASKDDLVAIDPSWRGTELVVGDLAPDDAAELLIARGVEEKEARLLATRFGGNPLLLRLLADFRRHNPDVAIKDLVRGRSRGRGGTDWRMAYLYKRILSHIRDPQVAKLAHPGLVLRRVSAPLIAEVLARPCGLGVVDDTLARDLFDRLARNVWLVERRAGEVDEVFHRRDLRRLMLPLVTAEQPGKVATIHRAAIRFYSAAANRASVSKAARKTSGQSGAWAEGLYHELMLDRKRLPPLSESRAVEFRSLIGTDIDDLPVVARATVKARGGADLTASEIRALPFDERIGPVEGQISRNSDPAAAVAFAAEALGPGWRSRLRPSHAIQLLHATADLEGVAAFGAYLRDPEALVEATSIGRSGGEVVDSSLWRVAVFRHLFGARLAIRRVRSRPDTIDELALRESLLLLASRSTGPRDADKLGVRDGIDFGAMIRLTSSLPGGTIVLRHAMLIGRPTPATLRLSKLPLLDPRIVARFDRLFPKDQTRFAGIDRQELARQLAFFADKRNAPKLRLKEVDDAINRWVDARVVLATPRSAAEILLRGINPEFQTPAATALFEIVDSPSRARALARAAWRISAVRPMELHPDRLAPALLDGQRSWLNQLVDIIDRAGRLGKLLDAALEVAPRSHRLGVVTRAYRKWDALLRAAWRRGANSARSPG